MNWLRICFIAQLALVMSQTIYYYPLMPSTMASHFDGAGVPNGWSGRDGFFGLYWLIIIMLAVIFLYVPKWSERRSNFGMKLPNRDYWLAPERIEQTRQFFRRQMLIMGNAHMLLALTSVQLVVMANFNPDPILDTRIFWALILYFIILTIWLIYFFLHFRRSVH